MGLEHPHVLTGLDLGSRTIKAVGLNQTKEGFSVAALAKAEWYARQAVRLVAERVDVLHDELDAAALRRGERDRCER